MVRSGLPKFTEPENPAEILFGGQEKEDSDRSPRHQMRKTRRSPEYSKENKTEQAQGTLI